MASIVIMPKQGLMMTEGTILKWLVKEGEQVTAGKPLFEMETDKLTITMDAEVSGTLLKILHPGGCGAHHRTHRHRRRGGDGCVRLHRRRRSCRSCRSPRCHACCCGSRRAGCRSRPGCQRQNLGVSSCPSARGGKCCGSGLCPRHRP